MTNKQKYILDNDDDGHWYIFPAEHKAEFEAWLNAVYNEDYGSPLYEQPEFVRRLDGPRSIIIHSYEEV